MAVADVLAVRDTARFAPNHRWDRNAVLGAVLLIWLGIVMGFGGDIAHHFEKHRPPYPLIVHFHAAAFVGWLVLLTTQVLLVRADRRGLHRKLGIAGIILACTMIVLGPATALIVDTLQVALPPSDPEFLGDPQFISVQLLDIVAFAGFVAAAIALRGQAPAHKRLMLLATMFISDAGFARWLGGPIHALLGDSPAVFFVGAYAGGDTLILALGAYDLITRRRLHPVYLAGVAWALAAQLTAVWLYFDPAWKQFALRLMGH